MSETRLDKLRMFYNTPSFLGVNHFYQLSKNLSEN